MSKTPHWTWPRLLDLTESGERDALAGEHLEACAPCRTLAAEVDQLLARLHNGRLTSPPRAWVERAWERISHLQTGAPKAESWADLMRRLANQLKHWEAGLRADSLTLGHAVRGAATASPRLLLYETEAYTVSLSIDASSGSTSLLGQVAPRSGDTLPNPRSALLHQDDESRETAISAFGEFQFEPVAPGEVRLALRLGNDLVTLTPLHMEGEGPKD